VTDELFDELRRVRDAFWAKRILAQLESMVADAAYMSAIGEEGRQRTRSMLKLARLIVHGK
jgi:hypothetical protein